ncbi:MAG TPA: glutathione peroxidase [Rhizomicrobium sp.]|jgi:glutathione peroxidase|nr:glutathione peroxidase [Rhizomicrobium sp.]
MNATRSREIYDFTVTTLSGQDRKLAEFRDKVLLIVNTASKCGFTPQYEGLETLYRNLHGRGLTVLGFPCNQFGRQEPGSATEIGEFCRINYGVSFPMFARIDVNGEKAHPLYKYLKREKPGIFGTGRIKWNFTKFLVNRQGAVLGRYAPLDKPRSLRKPIERLL